MARTATDWRRRSAAFPGPVLLEEVEGDAEQDDDDEDDDEARDLPRRGGDEGGADQDQHQGITKSRRHLEREPVASPSGRRHSGPWRSRRAAASSALRPLGPLPICRSSSACGNCQNGTGVAAPAGIAALSLMVPRGRVSDGDGGRRDHRQPADDAIDLGQLGHWAPELG